jgi:superfamily II DNA or RNA helicase
MAGPPRSASLMARRGRDEGQAVTIKLRPYQVHCREAVHAAHERIDRPAAVLATGAGKSVILADVARTSRHGAAGGRRTLVVAHREELVEQNAQKVRDVAPDLRTGVVMAGRNETQGHVISASVQTLAGELRRKQLRDVGLVIIDEAHHAAADSYVSLLHHFGCFDGRAKALGFTATMSRGDERALGDVWQDVVYVKDTSELIAEGYLVRPIAFRVRVDDLDLASIRKAAGDFSVAGLGRAVEESMAPKKIVDAWFEHAPGKPTIAFAPLVSTAEVFRDEWRARGVAAEVVSDKTPKQERRRIIQAYRDGAVTVLCNAMIFTEGTDLPMTECVVIGRPTMSSALFVQMVGRGLRLWAGKSVCVVLDVVGATGRHRLAAPVELWGDEGVDLEQMAPRDADEVLELLEVDDDVQEQAEVDHLLGLDEPAYRDGKLVTEVVDLFEGSDAGWLRTYAGVWFLAAPERYVAVLPRWEGGYGVVSLHRTRTGESSWVMESVSELSYAMAHAIGDITDDERHGMERVNGSARAHFSATHGWRSASPRAEARRIGLPVPEDASAGEIRRMLIVAYASARIDQALPVWVRR